MKLEHGRRTGRTVETSELRLTRQSVKIDEWYLDPAWIESNDPPGDLVEETRRIVKARRIEGLRIPSILATLVTVGLGCILGLASLVLTLTRRYSFVTKCLAAVALVLCLTAFAFSSLSHWRDSELFGGGTLLLPCALGGGLVLTLLAFILAPDLDKAG